MKKPQAFLELLCIGSIAFRWLILACTSLAASGLLAIMLVIARTPGLHHLLPYADFFRVTLIIHVNLAVLIFMLAMCVVIWNLYLGETYKKFAKISWWLAVFATFLIAASPYIMDGTPLLNNYIPIYDQPFFISGIVLFGIAILVELIRVVCCIFLVKIHSTNSLLPTKILSSSIQLAVVTCVAGLCFILSHIYISEPSVVNLFNREDYFDLMLWGGGHVLQFTYTLGLLFAWLILLRSMGIEIAPHATFILITFCLHTLLALPSPIIYFTHGITDFWHMEFFTQHMRHAGGIAPIIIGLLVVYVLKKASHSTDPISRNALYSSMILFGCGGVLGYAIQGSNTIVPAHYHGSIVGVTIAFMGMAYVLLRHYGFSITLPKTAKIQPILYGAGQIIHITGLAISGGYGALRKTPGAMETMEAKISMGLMGFGGLISVIGGLLFVVVFFHAVFKSKCHG